MRRLRQGATVIGTILLTLGSTINVGQAATLITNIIRQPTPADVNNPNIVFRSLCPPTCQLRDEESLNTNLPPTIVTNNSFNLTSVIYTIPQFRFMRLLLLSARLFFFG